MSNWREKIWVKITALILVGAFCLPSPHQAMGKIYQEIASLLIPLAQAEELLPYTEDNHDVMPVLNPNSEWKKPSDTVIDTVPPTEETQEPAGDQDTEQQPQPQEQTAQEGENQISVLMIPRPDSPSIKEETVPEQTKQEPKSQAAAEPNKIPEQAEAQKEQKAIEPEPIEEAKEETGKARMAPPKEPEITQPAETQEKKLDMGLLSNEWPHPLKSVQIQESTVVVPKTEAKAELIVKETNNEKEEKLTPGVKEPIRAKGTGEPLRQDKNSLYLSGTKFLLPPLDAFIPLAQPQACNAAQIKDNLGYDNIALVAEENRVSYANYLAENTSTRIEELYAAHPATGPPEKDSHNPLPTATVPYQGWGNSPSDQAAALTGILISGTPSGSILQGQVLLPHNIDLSLVYNHGPPL